MTDPTTDPSVGPHRPTPATPAGDGSPPVGSPPVGSPPVGSPPVGSPPVGSPPVGSPPVSTPPLDPAATTVASDGGSSTGDGGDAAGEGGADTTEAKKKSGSFLRELPILIAVALVLALLIKAFLVQAFYIPSGSMEETLRVGDRVLVNKLVYRFRSIHRGEIVVFNGDDTSFQPEVSNPPPSNPIARALRSFASALGVAPPGEKDFIKRVIGVEGDRVACCDSEGRVTVNDIPLNESYLYPNDSPSEQEFSVEVPDDYIWVMGDHRSASQDSRAYVDQPGGGFIPTRKVIGRAFVKVWPPSHMGTLGVPKTFDQEALKSLGWGAALPVDPALGVAGLGLLPFAGRRRPRPAHRPAHTR
jgi:signal peptidase I